MNAMALFVVRFATTRGTDGNDNGKLFLFAMSACERERVSAFRTWFYLAISIDRFNWCFRMQSHRNFVARVSTRRMSSSTGTSKRELCKNALNQF